MSAKKDAATNEHLDTENEKAWLMKSRMFMQNKKEKFKVLVIVKIQRKKLTTI